MRQTVVQTNRLLEKFGELASVNWVPLWDVFLDAEGNLPARIMPDALHPNAKGYKIWADEVVPVIEATLARTP
jgi:lysophospholipase L1-like esterase